MQVEKIWLLEDINHNISIRMETSREVTGVPTLVVNERVLPPMGQSLNIDDARLQKLQQDHFTIYGLNTEDLAYLAEEIFHHLVRNGHSDKINLTYKRSR